ncbi:transcriptional antiterminator, BglG family [Anaerobranca californiensis DSM 14826]|jgi:transcriptional antiterminator|uniref:Transcriptional antiterminator, BglG family n=1 Tax=Anaerobranca californiensis DSM 14826 TaxID=1120989 RepID=A0A1M6Q863_9FIRM|nr:PRD domain-containing protein [Anaerobranca californiensis]SHK16442.1 transcriptional antiterminator, BglG family [Anaerobranca californiensis DSM 14826]
MAKYEIVKTLSNNVVLVKDKGQKYVFIGKGIGFGKRSGDLIDINKVEQKFVSTDTLKGGEYEAIFDTIDPKIIEIYDRVNEIILGELEGKNQGDDIKSLNIALLDHINFAIKRLKEGIEIVNPFLYEIKLLYPEEYKTAAKVVDFLQSKLDIEIPEGEIGFLALHFVGGISENKQEALAQSKMINKIHQHLEQRLGIKIEHDSFDYKRLIIHLKGVINRVKKSQCIENNVLSALKDKIIYEYKMAYDIAKIMERALNISIPENEIGYIALHIYKITGGKN